ncbi:YcxB family protein [Actinoplanes sp. NPDC026670]|uniref:YcxB family protein n=1 Tax=Actinoplanes sp. NPDC026670 TaxID=3154700 RepID=UPI0034105DE2
MDTETGFSFSAHPTRQQLLVSLRQFMRGQLRLFRLAGALLIVFGLVFSLDDELVLRIFTVLFGLICILVVPELTVRTVVAKVQGMLSRPTEYRIDERGIRMTNDLTEFFVSWIAVDRLDEAPGLLIARTGQTGFYAVPTGALPPEKAAEVTAYVRAHVRHR